MVKKYSLILDNEFIQYCKLNNIEDIEGKAKEVFTQGFTILKYGEIPNIQIPKVNPPTTLPEPIKVPETTVKKDLYGE